MPRGRFMWHFWDKSTWVQEVKEKNDQFEAVTKSKGN